MNRSHSIRIKRKEVGAGAIKLQNLYLLEQNARLEKEAEQMGVSCRALRKIVKQSQDEQVYILKQFNAAQIQIQLLEAQLRERPQSNVRRGRFKGISKRIRHVSSRLTRKLQCIFNDVLCHSSIKCY